MMCVDHRSIYSVLYILALESKDEHLALESSDEH